MPMVYSDPTGPFGRNVHLSAAVRRAVRANGCDTPVVAAGGIHLFRQAESILGAGHADIVALARQALADPDWFEKVRTGHGAEVRRCHYTNYCEALDQQHREVTCPLILSNITNTLAAMAKPTCGPNAIWCVTLPIWWDCPTSSASSGAKSGPAGCCCCWAAASTAKNQPSGCGITPGAGDRRLDCAPLL